MTEPQTTKSEATEPQPAEPQTVSPYLITRSQLRRHDVLFLIPDAAWFSSSPDAVENRLDDASTPRLRVLKVYSTPRATASDPYAPPHPTHIDTDLGPWTVDFLAARGWRPYRFR